MSDYVYEEHAWLEVQIFMKGTDEEYLNIIQSKCIMYVFLFAHDARM